MLYVAFSYQFNHCYFSDDYDMSYVAGLDGVVAIPRADSEEETLPLMRNSRPSAEETTTLALESSTVPNSTSFYFNTINAHLLPIP